MPLQALAGNFKGVLFAVLARLSYEPERQARRALDSARFLALTATALCFLRPCARLDRTRRHAWRALGVAIAVSFCYAAAPAAVSCRAFRPEQPVIVTIVQLYLAPAALAAAAIYAISGLDIFHDRGILKLAAVPLCSALVYALPLKLLAPELAGSLIARARSVVPWRAITGAVPRDESTRCGKLEGHDLG